jgi:hypothetical protein
MTSAAHDRSSARRVNCEAPTIAPPRRTATTEASGVFSNPLPRGFDGFAPVSAISRRLKPKSC